MSKLVKSLVRGRYKRAFHRAVHSKSTGMVESCKSTVCRACKRMGHNVSTEQGLDGRPEQRHGLKQNAHKHKSCHPGLTVL